MTAKIVCRLLTVSNELLGWTAVDAEVRGDGKLWSPGPVAIICERAGTVAALSLHWADVNIETRPTWPGPVPVLAGYTVTIYETASPMIIAGEMPGPLPPVTVGSVAVGIPVGSLGARGLA